MGEASSRRRNPSAGVYMPPFEEVYVSDGNGLYTEAPSSPDNDCYVSLPYRLKVGVGEFRNSPYVRTYDSGRRPEQYHLDMLNVVFPFEMRIAKGGGGGECADRWFIREGAGSNGKGGDYISDKSILGDYAKPMGGVNLVGVGAFRLPVSKMRDAIELRVQEYPHRNILGNICKRMATNEAPERCDEYEKARGYVIGGKLVIMEGNPVELPKIKSLRSFGVDDLTGAIGRG